MVGVRGIAPPRLTVSETGLSAVRGEPHTAGIVLVLLLVLVIENLPYENENEDEEEDEDE